MGIDRYDYRVPVALKFEIGDIDVTPNREEVRYTDKTIKMITDKLQEAKDELTAMISKQYDNVHTLDDYYNAKENFGHLTFKDQQNLYVGYWIKKSDVDYANFKYNDLPHIPSSDNLISLFYNVHEYGRSRGYRHSVKYGRSDNMVYQCKGKFERKLLKQSYLNYEFDKHFIILKPYMDLFTDDSRYEKVKVAFGVIKDDGTGQWGSPSYKFTMDEKKAEKLLKQLQKDIAKSVMSTFDSYDDLEVPEEFIEARKQERLSKEILNTTIVLTDIGRWSNKGRVKIKNIIDFKGRIFYGVTDDQQLVQEGYNMFTALFGDKHVDRVYGYRNQFEKGKGIMFVTVARANEKYLKMAPNAYRIELVYPMILRRKMINPNNIKIANDFVKKFEDLEEIYTSTGMELINAVAAKYYKEVKAEKADLEKYENFRYIDFNSTLVTKYFDPNKETKADLLIKTERQLDYLLGVQAKNAKTLKWIEMPYYVSKNDLSEDRYSGLVELLKKVMVF
jgi:hypothetical protein